MTMVRMNLSRRLKRLEAHIALTTEPEDLHTIVFLNAGDEAPTLTLQLGPNGSRTWTDLTDPIQTNQPLKPSVTGITGSRRVTVSDLRTPTESSHTNSCSALTRERASPSASQSFARTATTSSSRKAPEAFYSRRRYAMVTKRPPREDQQRTRRIKPHRAGGGTGSATSLATA